MACFGIVTWCFALIVVPRDATFFTFRSMRKEYSNGQQEWLPHGVESSRSITRGEGDMPDKGPGSKSSGKKPKGGAKPGDKKKK